MPYKTDGIPFQLHPRPTRSADDKPLLYARPVTGRKLDVNTVDELFTPGRSYRLGDFRRMMETFIELLSPYIADGYSVETPLGTFAPRLRTHGDYTDASQVTSGSVSYAGIEFRPSKAFSQEVLSHQRGCHKVATMVGNEQTRDAEAMDKALRQSLDHGLITVRAFCVNSGLKYGSARKYLDSLCQGDHPRLRCHKQGSMLLYEMAGDGMPRAL